jgi:hypothetical protein
MESVDRLRRSKIKEDKMLFRQNRNLLITIKSSRALFLLLLCVFILFPFHSSQAEIKLPPGYTVTTIHTVETGKWFSDLAFSPNGDLVFAVGSSTRIGCDSYVGYIPAGGGGAEIFAEPCIDHPSAIAFGPFTGDLLFLIEGAGYSDDLYMIERGTYMEYIQFIPSNSVVVSRDLEFNDSGELFAADTYLGRIIKISPSGEVSIFADGFPIAPDRHGQLDMDFGPDGLLYFAHHYAGTIYTLAPDGTVEIFSTAIAEPNGITVKENGDVYVSDSLTEAIYIISADGTITTFATGINPGVLEFGPDGALYMINNTVVLKIKNSTPHTTPQELIGELVDDTLMLDLQQGISINLDAKLDAALQALDDVNNQNDVAAINSLGSFINAVEAQRGNKIPEVDADYLIASTHEIIEMLLGG